MPSIYDLNRIAQKNPAEQFSLAGTIWGFIYRPFLYNFLESFGSSLQQSQFAYIPRYKPRQIINFPSTLLARGLQKAFFTKGKDSLVAQQFQQIQWGSLSEKVIEGITPQSTVYEILEKLTMDKEFYNSFLKGVQAENIPNLTHFIKDWSRNFSSFGGQPVLQDAIFSYLVKDELKKVGINLSGDTLRLFGKEFKQLVKNKSINKSIVSQLKWYRWARPAFALYTMWEITQWYQFIGQSITSQYQAGVALHERNQILKYYRRLGNISGISTVGATNDIQYSKAEETLIMHQIEKSYVTKQLLNDQGVFGTNPYQILYA